MLKHRRVGGVITIALTVLGVAAGLIYYVGIALLMTGGILSLV